MPLLNTSSLINSLANIISSSPGATNPAFSGPGSVPTYVNAIESAAQERANESSQIISNTPDLSSAVDQIIQKNRRLGLSDNGSSDFYDISLMYSPQMLRQSGESEPDGFQIYLMKPRKPAVDKVISMTQTGLNKTFDFVNNSGVGSAAVGAIDEAALGPLSEMVGLDPKEFGNTEALVGKINEKLEDVKTSYNESFQNLYNGYEEDPKGGSYYSAVLPLPKDLTDTHSHETDTLMLGALPRIMTAVGAGLFNFGGGNNYNNKRRTSGVAGLFGPGVAELAEYAVETTKARVGIGLNPNTEMIYSAPKPRSFNFNFELYPKSQDEAKNILDFIQQVKKHSYPASVGNILGQNQLYIFPGEVYFEFTGRYRNKMFRSLRPCIITDVSFSYSNGDQYQNFVDGSSIVYLITISLTETRLLDRNILEKEEKGEVDLRSQSGRDFIYGDGTLLGTGWRDVTTSEIANPQQPPALPSP